MSHRGLFILFAQIKQTPEEAASLLLTLSWPAPAKKWGASYTPM